MACLHIRMDAVFDVFQIDLDSTMHKMKDRNVKFLLFNQLLQ